MKTTLRNCYLFATTSIERKVFAGTSMDDCAAYTAAAAAAAGWQIVEFLAQDEDAMDQFGFLYTLQ